MHLVVSVNGYPVNVPDQFSFWVFQVNLADGVSFRVIAEQPLCSGPDPGNAFRVILYAVDSVVQQFCLHRLSERIFTVIVNDYPIVCSDKDISCGIFCKNIDIVGFYSQIFPSVVLDACAVISVEPFVGSYPHISATVLHDTFYGVIG